MAFQITQLIKSNLVTFGHKNNLILATEISSPLYLQKVSNLIPNESFSVSQLCSSLFLLYLSLAYRIAPHLSFHWITLACILRGCNGWKRSEARETKDLMC